jgi:membrane fusion protein (multidrug efflux system)
VGVITAKKQSIARSAELIGRIKALQRVDLRARVAGYLTAVRFKEGDHIKEGDPWFSVDPASFLAAGGGSAVHAG